MGIHIVAVVGLLETQYFDHRLRQSLAVTDPSAAILHIFKRAEQGDLPDVSMVEEDFNVREETININDTQIEETIDIDSEHTIELSDSDNEIDCEVVNQIIESTINITDEDTVENVSNMEYSNESDEDENSNSNNISSSQYFPECPVHNHHTDNDSICPDDPPCSCMSEI